MADLSPKTVSNAGAAGKWTPWLWAFAILLLTLATQAVYCHTVTNDDWTGLFYNGAVFVRPAEVGGYAYAGSGYDAQFYRLVAHDPFGEKGYWKYMDAPRYRARRGLLPLAAALAGGGSARATDFAFIALVDLSLALGFVAFLRLTQGYCRPLVTACLYVLVPAVVAATDRMLLDGVLAAAFCGVWLFYRDRRTGALFALLWMVPFLRETGICITAGVVLAYGSARLYRHAAGAAATVLPAAGWWWFVTARTTSTPLATNLSLPVVPEVLRLFTLVPRAAPPPLNLLLEGLDWVACICLLIALGYFGKVAWEAVRSRRLEADVLLVFPSAVLSACSGGPAIMNDPYAFLRVNGVLFVWAFVRVVRFSPAAAVGYAAASGAALLVFRASPLARLLGLAGR